MSNDSYNIEYLQSLPEDNLRKQVLLPLLIRMGLRDVLEYHGGTAEKGKDIVGHYSDIMGQRHYVGVVVKRGDIHGCVGKTGNASEVLFQVQQSLNEPFSDSYHLTPADISECWVITTGEIKNTAMESIRGTLHKSNLDKTTRMIDAHKLVSLIDQHMPEFWLHERVLVGMAHEMRSHISMVMSAASFLARRSDKLKPEEVREAVEDIVAQVRLLARLGESATMLYRREFHLRPRPHRLGDVLHETVASACRILKAKNLSVSIPDAAPLNAVGAISLDLEAFGQVVFNLLKNVVDFRGETEPRAQLSYTVTDKEAVLHFRDSGIGVPEGYEEQIFCAGVRAPNAVREGSPSAGIGLTISRRLLGALGGNIRLTNRCSPTEFTVYLPRGEQK
jgi:K+-sensing histidine kinase KdpD